MHNLKIIYNKLNLQLEEFHDYLNAYQGELRY